MRRNLAIVFAFLVIATTFWCCTQPTGSTTGGKATPTIATTYAALSDSATYVGKQACQGCHPDIYAGFMKNGMGQSFDSATRQKSLAEFGPHTDVYDAKSDFHYHPHWENGKLFVLEYRLSGNDTTYRRNQRIDYIIGSGHHTNSHFTRINGYLYQVPVTFYTQKKHWDLPPGFEGGHNTRFSRAIQAECVTCHNGYPTLEAGTDNKFVSLPHGLDCERCHGPGSQHIAEKQAGHLVNIKKDIDYSIVNPRKLPFKLQVSVCQRCHLQGNAVLQPGKTFFDFKPGQPLSQTMDVYLPRYAGEQNRFIMASHADRMMLSPCFLKSGERLTCITCHNPHAPVQSVDYNAKCTSCHASLQHPPLSLGKGVAATNCVACHMPKSGTSDIPHVTVTDHYIRARPKPATAANGLGKFIGLAAINNANPTPLSKATAYVQYYEKFDHQASFLDSARVYVQRITPKDALWFDVAVHIEFAATAYPRILALAAANAPFAQQANAWTAYRLAEAYTNANDFATARRQLQTAVALAPSNLEFHNKLAAVAVAQNDAPAAEAEYRKLIALNPEYAPAYANLAYLQLAKADAPAAKQLLDKALALDPDYPQALVNLAGYYAYTGDIARAKATLQLLLRKQPHNAAALNALKTLRG